jgi:FkbM family methyltransferase
MKKQFNTASRGTFVLDTETNQKMAQLFERFVHPQEDELEILEKYLDGESVFLDIGANIGTITMPMAKIAKTVLAFEPVPVNVDLLEENKKLNNSENVQIFPVALGATAGLVGLEAQGAAETGTYSVRGEGNIPLVTLDSLSTSPTVIKLDVEGYEIDVLKGARETLKKYKPVILFEINLIETRKRHDWWLRAVSSELRSHGYALYLPTETGLKRVRSMAWTMFTQAPKAFLSGRLHYSRNFLAIPN